MTEVVKAASKRRRAGLNGASSAAPNGGESATDGAGDGDANGHSHAAGEALTLPRGRHNLSREQVETTQRERILTGMVQALAENGYARTTVADVIARSHTSRETFYEHFENKQACFLAAYARAVEE